MKTTADLAAARFFSNDAIVKAIEARILALPAAQNGADVGQWEGLVAARHFRIAELAHARRLTYPVRYQFGAWHVA